MTVTINGSTGWSYSDNIKHKYGTGEDLEIFHDGTNSYIKDTGTGNLVLATSELSINNAASNEEMIKATQDGVVELHYNGSKKFETLTDGVNVTGTLKVNGSAFSSGLATTGGTLTGDLGIGIAPDNFGSYRTLHIKGPSGEGAAIRLQDNGDTADSSDAVIYKNSNALYLRVNGSDKLITYMNGHERVRIDGDGLMGTCSNDHCLSVTTVQDAGTSKYLFRGHHSATQGDTNTGNLVFTVWSNGNVESATNSYGSTSDVKLKENIVDANSQWNDIKTIKIRNYNFKAETGNPTHTQIGVVAQELETVCPKLVYETPDLNDKGEDLGTTTKAVNYSVLYMKAIKALQEAMTKIETLETKVAALEAA